MFKRVLIVFGIVFLVSPLMFLGTVFRQANISGYPVFSEANMLSALPMFGVVVVVLFIGLLIPWGEDEPRDDDESRKDKDTH